MALIFVDVVADCDCNIESCDSVYVCLRPEWEERTVSGFALAEGRIVSINEWTSGTTGSCCDCATVCKDKCIYQVEINDDQFIVNPVTGLPWEPGSADILELIPYACTIGKLISGVVNRPDWVLDCAEVELTADSGLNTNTIDFPIIDRVSSDLITTCNVVIPGATLVPDNVASELTFTSSPGTVTVIDMCDLIAPCVAGLAPPTLTAGAAAPSGADTLVYSNGGVVIYQGPENLIHTNTCSGGVGADYAIRDFSDLDKLREILKQK